MKFQIYKDKSGEWRWRLLASNGQNIASGEGYKNKSDCQNAVDLVKRSGSASVEEV